MTKLYAKIYYDGRNSIHPIRDVAEEDAKFFIDNGIMISIEELAGDIIIYGCPSKDVSEESEIIVFANGRSCIEVMSDLANQCREIIKTGLWKDYM